MMRKNQPGEIWKTKILGRRNGSAKVLGAEMHLVYPGLDPNLWGLEFNELGVRGGRMGRNEVRKLDRNQII